MKYTAVLTRSEVLKALTSTHKMSLWWPTSAATEAELDVLIMPNAGAWNYKYGTLALPSGTPQVDTVAAASDPGNSYNFIFDPSSTPSKILSQSNLPPISSSRWNPDTAVSTNTADVLSMAFYKTLNSADTTAVLSSGSTVAMGVIFWPDSSAGSDRWTKEGNIEWIADTSTPPADTGT